MCKNKRLLIASAIFHRERNLERTFENIEIMKSIAL